MENKKSHGFIRGLIYELIDGFGFWSLVALMGVMAYWCHTDTEEEKIKYFDDVDLIPIQEREDYNPLMDKFDGFIDEYDIEKITESIEKAEATSEEIAEYQKSIDRYIEEANRFLEDNASEVDRDM